MRNSNQPDNKQIYFEKLICRRFSSLVLKVKILRTTVDYSLRAHQETGQNKTKSRDSRPKATITAGDNFIRVTSCVTEGWLFQISPHTKTNIVKNVSIYTVRRRLYEGRLYNKIAVKKPQLRKQNNVKSSSRPWRTNIGKQSSGKKSVGITNQSFKS